MAVDKGGRPTKMTPETVNKLEEVFAIGGSDEEACFYADISKQCLYNYQKEHPEYVDRKEQLKQKPFLKARKTIIKSLDNPQYAFEYMKRKNKKEFGDNVDLTSDQKKITPIISLKDYVQGNNSDQEDNSTQEEDKSS